VLVVQPASLTGPISVTSSSTDDWPDTTVQVGEVDYSLSSSKRTDGGFFIRTTGRVGIRLDERGGLHSIVDDLPTVAALAVMSLLLHDSPRLTSSALEALDRRATELGQRVRDPATWTIKRMTVDGEGFALYVHQAPEGFAAAGDLGHSTVTLYGRAVPEDLSFTVKEV
jgi:hypothetical protein